MKIFNNLKFIPDLILLVSTPLLIFYNLISYDGNGYYIVAHGQILGVNSNPREIISLILGGDSTYQLKFAIDYINNGEIGDWVLNLWPPGLPVLNIIFIELFGSHYYLLKALIFSTFIYTSASYIAYRCLRNRGQEYLIIIFISMIQLSESVKNSILNNLLFISSDFYCFCILLALVPILLRGVIKGISDLICISILVALLAYFRSYYFLIIQMSTLLVLTMAIIFIIYSYFFGTGYTIFDLNKNTLFKRIASIFLITWLLLLPWIILLKIELKPFLWTATDQVWAAQWRLDTPSFLAGINTPCLVEKDLCIKLMPFQLKDTWATPVLGSNFYKKLSLSTFISNPIIWYKEKLNFFYVFWYEGRHLVDLNSIDKFIQYFSSVAILIMCIYLPIYGIYSILKKYRYGNLIFNKDEAILFILFIFLSFNIIIFTFSHFESRYSLPLKLCVYVIFVYKVGSYFKSSKFSVARLRRGI